MFFSCMKAKETYHNYFNLFSRLSTLTPNRHRGASRRHAALLHHSRTRNAAKEKTLPRPSTSVNAAESTTSPPEHTTRRQSRRKNRSKTRRRRILVGRIFRKLSRFPLDQCCCRSDTQMTFVSIIQELRLA
jgi:hypothetical protein